MLQEDSRHDRAVESKPDLPSIPISEAERDTRVRESLRAELEKAGGFSERSKIPSRFQACSVSNFKANKRIREVGLRAVTDGRSVFITGPPGTGKTHLAVGLAKEYVAAKKNEAIESRVTELRRYSDRLYLEAVSAWQENLRRLAENDPEPIPECLLKSHEIVRKRKRGWTKRKQDFDEGKLPPKPQWRVELWGHPPDMPTPIFLPASEFYIELKRSYGSYDHFSQDESQLLDKYGSAPFLILDDIGSEKISDWSRQMLYILIDRRYRHERQTVVTTNLSLEEISELIDDRIASRFVEMGEIIRLSGPDARVENRQDSN